MTRMTRRGRTTVSPPAGADIRVGAAEDLLRRWIGLDASTIGSAAIERAVRSRMADLGVGSADALLDRVRTDAAERDRLVEEVIVAESWFFRDRQVFDFVRGFVCTLAAIPGRPPVRILSAPCASGEEPYSVAMDLLDAGLSPSLFSIDAVDVSHAALERAARAAYSANAFRNADTAFRDRWFRIESGAAVLDEAVRSRVRFAWANLLDESFLTDREPYDVIFCRNLLIYLTGDARQQMERTIDRLLRPDGLLVLGAAEPPIMRGDWIPAGGHSVFTLRRGVHAAPQRGPVRPDAPPAGRSRRSRGVPAATTTRAPEAPPAAPAAPTAAMPVDRRSLEEVLHEAGTLANARRFADAIALCETWQKGLGPAPEVFFLMGMLHQSAGDADRAEGCFHKTLYLDPSHEEALLSLALLASQRGDQRMADTYRQSAARALARKASP